MSVFSPSQVPRPIDTIELKIGSVRVGLAAASRLAERLRQRYGGFVQPCREGRPPPNILLTAGLDDDPPGDGEMAALPKVRLEQLDHDRFRLAGDCTASLDLVSRSGILERGEGLRDMDSLVRLSLSLLAPADGWVLLHGAAIAMASGDWTLVVGRSGVGKSSAASAFVSFCDELVLARPTGNSGQAASTPYWNGRPGCAACQAIVCLERSETPTSRWLRGADAVRTLLPHVVRHVSREVTDARTFDRLCALVERVPIAFIGLSTGDSYVTRLGFALETLGLAPMSRIS